MAKSIKSYLTIFFLILSFYIDAQENCGDGIDNNNDGYIDCDDVECTGISFCAENCSNDKDDDGDGLKDCNDTKCALAKVCVTKYEVCNDGRDNDSDGLADCEDSDCRFKENCVAVLEQCGNGIDDDNDQRIDCEDLDCAATSFCASSCSPATPIVHQFGMPPSDLFAVMTANKELDETAKGDKK